MRFYYVAQRQPPKVTVIKNLIRIIAKCNGVVLIQIILGRTGWNALESIRSLEVK